MKRYLLIIILFFISITSYAQFTLLNQETGNQIQNGDVVTVNTNNFTTHIIITNTYSSDINLSLQVMDIVNTDGSEINWCFGINGHGQCYFRMTNGETRHGGASLAPGASTSASDFDLTHVDNSQDYPNYPKDYVVKLFATNPADNMIIGSSITFTYRYDPSASSFTKVTKNEFSIFIKSNHNIVIDTKKPVVLIIYNITGQREKEFNLSSGLHQLNLGKLKAGVYLIYAKTSNKQIYRKVVIQ